MGRIMKTNHLKGLCVLLTAISLALSVGIVHASQPIVIGCPLAAAFLYGWDAERGVTLAVEEINAGGGSSPEFEGGMEFGTTAFVFAKLIGVPALFTVVLTVLISPIFVLVYRQRLGAWMGKSSGSSAGERELPQNDTVHTIVLDELTQRAPGKHKQASSALSAQADAQIQRTARAYVIAGVAHAVVLTVAFTLRHQSVISVMSLATAFVVFSLPAIVTVLHIVSSSGWRQLGVVTAVMLALIVAAGDARGLAIDVFELHLLLPGSLFLLFSLRFWRGVAPMTLLVLAAGSVGWVVMAHIGSSFSGGENPALWLWRLLGFLAGTWIGLKLLGRVSERYDQGRLSDQALFLDAWWLLYTLIQTVIFIMTGGPAYTWVLLAFPAYWLVKRKMLSKHEVLQAASPHRLLLLRVFGFNRRTERFFGALNLRWRAVGAVELIAGRDLALRQITPIDFVAFLSGKLASRFVRDPAAATVMDAIENPDPEGRFRVRQYLCHADTWRPVMRALAAQSDVVVMDLRGFTADRQGCRYELESLARLSPDKPVILVVDRKTDLDTVRASLGASANSHGDRHERCARWTLVRARRGRDAGHQVFELIAGRLH
jgi:hypothetical protein